MLICSFPFFFNLFFLSFSPPFPSLRFFIFLVPCEIKEKNRHTILIKYTEREINNNKLEKITLFRASAPQPRPRSPKPASSA